MENATTIALSRLIAQQRAMDVTATKIANMSTPGYRAGRMVFSDWLVRQPGGRTDSYVQDRASYWDRQAGPLTHTGNPLDLAIAGDGYFTVQTAAGPRLTRAGHFELAPNGTIVNENAQALLDTAGQPLQVSPGDSHLVVKGDGSISSESGQIGQIGVVVPADPSRLRPEGAMLLAADSATQPNAKPRLVQGAVEGSNIQPTSEVTRMMNDVREFQFVSQFVQGEADRQQNAIDKIIAQRN
jgi:flagellar basal-body rod protein FlgF